MSLKQVKTRGIFEAQNNEV